MVAYKNMVRATADEKRHLVRVRGLPCCICLPNEQQSPTEAHHLLSGGQRMGHYFCVPLCHQHHDNVYKYAIMMRALWVQVMATLGVTDVEWPTSKVCKRAG